MGRRSGKNYSKSIDNIWIRQEVIPKWLANYFIVACCSFIEDQLEALKVENPNARGNFRKEVNIIFKNYGKRNLLNESPPIIDEIYLLRNIRNCLVHEGGRIKPLGFESDYKDMINRTIYNRIKEVGDLSLEPSGIIIVEKEFCEYAINVVERFVNYITQLSTKY